MSRISEGAARAAAAWWRKSVGKGAKCDAGIGSPGDFDSLMREAQLLAIIKLSRAKSDDQDEEALARFEEELYRRVLAYDGPGWCDLDVDYHPNALLGDAAEAAGLKLGMDEWPWKTTMWVHPDKVEVSHGYGAPSKEIYPTGGLNAIVEIIEREERGNEPW